jgi:hypothetical protein
MLIALAATMYYWIKAMQQTKPHIRPSTITPDPAGTILLFGNLFRCRKPHPPGVVMWDWLRRSRMGMAEEAAHCYPYIELMPQHRQ